MQLKITKRLLFVLLNIFLVGKEEITFLNTTAFGASLFSGQSIDYWDVRQAVTFRTDFFFSLSIFQKKIIINKIIMFFVKIIFLPGIQILSGWGQDGDADKKKKNSLKRNHINFVYFFGKMVRKTNSAFRNLLLYHILSHRLKYTYCNSF